MKFIGNPQPGVKTYFGPIDERVIIYPQFYGNNKDMSRIKLCYYNLTFNHA